MNYYLTKHPKRIFNEDSELVFEFKGNPTHESIKDKILTLLNEGDLLHVEEEVWFEYLSKHSNNILLVTRETIIGIVASSYLKDGGVNEYTKVKGIKVLKGKKTKKPNYPQYAKLPKDYVFTFGRYESYSIKQVPANYIDWFENFVPTNRWGIKFK